MIPQKVYKAEWVFLLSSRAYSQGPTRDEVANQ
ncbi:hypothetical protein FG05_35172 [Fusarium graminearum]|nr:hypothetical protein FG05_35172 [Fusarium graminearum]